jgi:hypothetical protein
MSTATLRFQLPEEEHEFRRAMLGDLAIQDAVACRPALPWCHQARRREQETAAILQQIREMIPGELIDA